MPTRSPAAPPPRWAAPPRWLRSAWSWPSLEIKLTTDGRGFGLFVTEDQPAGMLIPYVGRVLCRRSVDALAKRGLAAYVLETADAGVFIDARPVGWPTQHKHTAYAGGFVNEPLQGELYNASFEHSVTIHLITRRLTECRRTPATTGVTVRWWS